MRIRKLVFHPVSVVVVSVVSALLYAAWVTWRFAGGDLTHHYFYVVPVVVPSVAFLFDRAQRIQVTSPFAAATDALIVFISLLRMLSLVPVISGHALFLGYALLRHWLTGDADQCSGVIGGDGLPEVFCLA
ncbi:MAG TPA: hypothetical protein VIT88_08295 [Pyrinomonadaceae bacterium]